MKETTGFHDESEAHKDADDSDVPDGTVKQVANPSATKTSKAEKMNGTNQSTKEKLVVGFVRPKNASSYGVRRWKASRELIWTGMGHLFWECRDRLGMTWHNVVIEAAISKDTCCELSKSEASSDARLQLTTFFRSTGLCDDIIEDIFYLFMASTGPESEFKAALAHVKKRAQEREGEEKKSKFVFIFQNKETMRVCYLGMGVNLGCDTDGVENAPALLRKELLTNYKFKVEDRGDIYCPKRKEFPDKYAWDKKIKYAGPIASCSRELAKTVFQLLNEGKFPFVCGGDHVEALGTLAGVSSFYGRDRLGVIYIDAHGDFNTASTSPSHNAHGMHMAALMGWGEDRLTKKINKNPFLKPENIYFFGTRALDAGEQELAKMHSMKIYSPAHIRKQGLLKLLEEVWKDIRSRKIDKLHISFDIDAVDPQLAPGTGVKEPNGLTPEEVEEIILFFLKKKKVCSMDFVELNEELDESESTVRLTLGTLAKILDCICE